MLEKQYLIFNDDYPNGAIKSLQYVKTYPDFMTYVELDEVNEVKQWIKALNDMQAILRVDLDSASLN